MSFFVSPRAVSLSAATAIASLALTVQPVRSEANRPLAILVNSDVNQMQQVESALKDLNAEIWEIPHTDIATNTGTIKLRSSDNPDNVSVLNGGYFLNQIPEDRPLFLIGQGTGVRSLTNLVPFIERPIQLVALIEAPANQADLYANVITPQVGVFLNYFDLPNPQSNGNLSCGLETNCYQFESTGDRPDTATWIQDDIIAKLPDALNAKPISRPFASLIAARPTQTAPAIAQCENDILLRPGNTGLTIQPGTEWNTCDGYRLSFQLDGNFVLYNPFGVPLWSSNTWFPNDPADTLTVQADGNVVIYRRGTSLWSTNTSGNTNAIFAFQKNGELTLYTESFQPLWSSNTRGR